MSTDSIDPVLGPWERRRIRTSLEVERAGLGLIVKRGLNNVTVDQVAASAGVSTRTFFRYFRNVPDLLTGVPRREVDRSCRVVLARPPGEGLLDALGAAYEVSGDHPDGENEDLRIENLALWTAIVRADPDTVNTYSRAVSVMTSGYRKMIVARLRLSPQDELTARGTRICARGGHLVRLER